MLIDCRSIDLIIPTIQLYIFNIEHNFLIKTNLLKNALLVIKKHFQYQFKILTYISGSDYPTNYYRFNIVYDLLSVKYNSRLRIKVIANEITPINSIEKIFIGADWWESEVWDMFGIFFFNKENNTRLLTDYGFQGYPLRKDFPLAGFTESRYSVTKSRIAYENIELAQEYRTFNSMSPWEELYKT